jgi:hypothetical protein
MARVRAAVYVSHLLPNGISMADFRRRFGM